MEIKVNQMIHIIIDDDYLFSWSYDRDTGIYTLVQTDKTVWVYDSKIKKLYNRTQWQYEETMKFENV